MQVRDEWLWKIDIFNINDKLKYNVPCFNVKLNFIIEYEYCIKYKVFSIIEFIWLLIL